MNMPNKSGLQWSEVNETVGLFLMPPNISVFSEIPGN